MPTSIKALVLKMAKITRKYMLGILEVLGYLSEMKISTQRRNKNKQKYQVYKIGVNPERGKVSYHK